MKNPYTATLYQFSQTFLQVLNIFIQLEISLEPLSIFSSSAYWTSL